MLVSVKALSHQLPQYWSSILGRPDTKYKIHEYHRHRSDVATYRKNKHPEPRTPAHARCGGWGAPGQALAGLAWYKWCCATSWLEDNDVTLAVGGGECLFPPSLTLNESCARQAYSPPHYCRVHTWLLHMSDLVSCLSLPSGALEAARSTVRRSDLTDGGDPDAAETLIHYLASHITPSLVCSNSTPFVSLAFTIFQPSHPVPLVPAHLICHLLQGKLHSQILLTRLAAQGERPKAARHTPLFSGTSRS